MTEQWVLEDSAAAREALYKQELGPDEQWRPYEDDIELSAAEIAALQSGKTVLYFYNGEVMFIIRQAEGM